MNPSKKNSTLWYSLGLVLIFCIAVLVLATGVTFARYRRDIEAEVTFAAEEAAKICIGTVSEEEGEKTFTMMGSPEWTDESGGKTLSFAVANMDSSDKKVFEKNQRIRIRIIGSAGLKTEGGITEIKLIFLSEEDSGEEISVTAAAEPIKEGSYLYQTEGPGWIFTFLDEDGEEIFWDLKGGSLSYAEIKIFVGSPNLESDVKIEPRISAEVLS